MINVLNKQHLARTLGLLASAVLLSGCLSQLPAPVRGAGGGEPTRSTAQDGVTHVVQPGDTLMGIGRTYNRSVADLVSWNGLSDPNQIKVGQRLRVSPPGMGTAAPAEGVVVQPIDMGGEVAGGVVVPAVPSTFDSPKGGTVAYSDQAWAAVHPRPEPIAAPLPAPQAPAATTLPAKPVPWMWPAQGPVIEKFDEATNKGIDISGKPGDPVLASAAGSVAYAGSGLRGYGKAIIINHADDYLTVYAHNQTLLVKEGDKVTQGQKIAEMGSTDADRPKLHFEIRRQGRPSDPMQYLPAR